MQLDNMLIQSVQGKGSYAARDTYCRPFFAVLGVIQLEYTMPQLCA